MRISGFTTHDIRFPTSASGHGSDARNVDPDYSCAYVRFYSDDEVLGQGLTFTIGRGNELCVSAIEILAQKIVGYRLDDFASDLALVSRLLLGDSQLRWLGPEKGVVHLAAAAIINAVWDALAKQAGMPLWQYVSSLAPDRILEAVDFTYIEDFIARDEVHDWLADLAPSRGERIERLKNIGYPAYTTSVGWLGYDDAELKERLLAAREGGWTHFKLKVGKGIEDDRRRCRLFREVLGQDATLSIDANQVWGVSEAIGWVRALEEFGIHWIEEPTHPDDIVAHGKIAQGIAPIRVASGEHAHNQIMFKQLLQTGAIAFCQIDACRLAGVNENLAVMLMARKAGIPVCPHAGGVGLCEYVQHLSMIDYICISGSMEDRVIEHAGDLHHHFEEPIIIRNGRYFPPQAPGYSSDLRQASIDRYLYPSGTYWVSEKD